MRGNIGARRFEPPTCRRGDHSIVVCRVHPYRARFCNIARVVPLRSEWQTLHYLAVSTVLHVSSPWNHQRYGGEFAQSTFRKNLRSVVRFFGSATRSNRNILRLSIIHVGARGFEPPTSWSQTTRSTKLSYAPNSGLILYHG
jgi:hypothetical protein